MTYEAVAFILMLYVLPSIAFLLEVYYAADDPYELEEARITREIRYGRR
jgi:hypothetical protein